MQQSMTYSDYYATKINIDECFNSESKDFTNSFKHKKQEIINIKLV